MDQGLRHRPPNRGGASGKKKAAATEAATAQKIRPTRTYDMLGPQATAGLAHQELRALPPECRAELARLLLVGLDRERRRRVTRHAMAVLP